MAAGDAGIVEHARQAVEQGFLAAERLARQGFRVVLLDDVRRNRGREREEAAGSHVIAL